MIRCSVGHYEASRPLAAGSDMLDDATCVELESALLPRPLSQLCSEQPEP